MGELHGSLRPNPCVNIVGLSSLRSKVWHSWLRLMMCRWWRQIHANSQVRGPSVPRLLLASQQVQGHLRRTDHEHHPGLFGEIRIESNQRLPTSYQRGWYYDIWYILWMHSYTKGGIMKFLIWWLVTDVSLFDGLIEAHPYTRTAAFLPCGIP